MSYDIGARIGIDGEKAFRDSLKAINANIKATGSELKAVTAQFTKNAESEEALTSKNAVLAKSIDATKDKIAVLEKQLGRQAEKLRELGKAADEAAAAHGKDSKEALNAQNAYNRQATAVAKLQDQLNGAKAELAGMENAVRDNKDAIDGLGREVEDTGEAMEDAGKSAVSFGDILKANIVSDLVVDGLRRITDGLKDVARFSLESFSNYEQLTGGVETLFKESSTKVQGYAETAYKTAGMSANEYMETVTSFSASLLQGLGGDTAKAAELADLAITDMADNANKMGTDMASIQYAYQGFAKQNYTMLDNLKLGYGGTQAEMIRLINDSGVLNEKIEDLDNVTFDQMVQAIHEVQTQIGITGTTALEAEETIQGSTASMKSAWENLVTGLASGDQDLGQLAENFAASAETAAKNIIPRIGIILSNIGPMIGEMLQTNLAANLPDMAKSGLETIDSFVQGLTDGLSNLRESAASLVDGLSSYFADNTPILISSGLDMISGFASSLRENAGLLVDSGIQLVLSLGQGLADSFPNIIQKLPGIVSDIAGVINDNAPKILEAGINIIVTLGKGLIDSIPTLVKNIPQIIGAVVDVFTAFNWMNLGKNIINGLNNGIKSLIGNVKTTAKTVVQNLRTVFADLPGYLKAIGKDMIQGLWNGIKSMGTWLKDKVASLLGGIFGSVSSSMRNESANLAKSAASPRSAAPAAEEAVFSMRAAPAVAAVQSLQRSVAEAETGVRAGAALRQVRRDINSTAGSVAAYYSIPDNRNGNGRQVKNNGNGLDTAVIVQAMRESLEGAKFIVDGRTLGRLTMTQHNNMGRAFGTL